MLKKWFVLGLILLSITFSFYTISAKEKCLNEINLDNLNSKNLINYILDNKLGDKIKKICSKDICTEVYFTTLESDIKKFITTELNYLKKINNDLAIEAELKGFKVDRIILNSCL